MALFVRLSLGSMEIKSKHHSWHQPPDDNAECNLQPTTAS